MIPTLGGADKSVVVFNKDTEQVTAVMKGHTKKVTNVIYHPTEVRRLGLIKEGRGST